MNKTGHWKHKYWCLQSYSFCIRQLVVLKICRIWILGIWPYFILLFLGTHLIYITWRETKLSKIIGTFECSVCSQALMSVVITFIVCWTYHVTGSGHYILFHLIFTMQLLPFYQRKLMEERISNLLRVTLKVIHGAKI